MGATPRQGSIASETRSLAHADYNERDRATGEHHSAHGPWPPGGNCVTLCLHYAGGEYRRWERISSRESRRRSITDASGPITRARFAPSCLTPGPCRRHSWSAICRNIHCAHRRGIRQTTVQPSRYSQALTRSRTVDTSSANLLPAPHYPARGRHLAHGRLAATRGAAPRTSAVLGPVQPAPARCRHRTPARTRSAEAGRPRSVPAPGLIQDDGQRTWKLALLLIRERRRTTQQDKPASKPHEDQTAQTERHGRSSCPTATPHLSRQVTAIGLLLAPRRRIAAAHRPGRLLAPHRRTELAKAFGR
jgi:hypothetical protein